MTTKKLSWKFKELPNATDLAKMVDTKIITPVEARQIAFSEGDADNDKLKTEVKAQAEEIKFLRELCDKLAAKSNGWTTIVREYRDYSPRYPYWYNSYGNVINTLSKPMATSGYVSIGNTGGNLTNPVTTTGTSGNSFFTTKTSGSLLTVNNNTSPISSTVGLSSIS